MKRLLIALPLLLVGVNAQGQTVKSDHFLDLGRIPATSSDTEDLAPGSGSATIDQKRAAIPLELSLASVTESALAWGADYVFELILTNRGDKRVALPWSRDAALIRAVQPERDEIVTMGLSFEILSSLGTRLAFVPGKTLYGTKLLPGSLVAVKPGETVLIRVPGQLIVSSTEHDKVQRYIASNTQVLVGGLVTSSTLFKGELRSRTTIPVTIEPVKR